MSIPVAFPTVYVTGTLLKNENSYSQEKTWSGKKKKKDFAKEILK